MRKRWDPTEAKLLVLDLKVPHSPTIQGMLQGWATTSVKLEFKFHDESIMSSAFMDQVLILYKKTFGIVDVELKELRIFLFNCNIKMVLDLRGGEMISGGDLRTS